MCCVHLYMCKRSQNVCKCMLIKLTVWLWASQSNFFNNLINLWNWRRWGLACSKCSSLILVISWFWQNVFQAKNADFFFFVFPSYECSKFHNTLIVVSEGGSFYKCGILQAAKISCVIVPCADILIPGSLFQVWCLKSNVNSLHG